MSKQTTVLWLTVEQLSEYGLTKQAVYACNQRQFAGKGIKSGKIEAYRWLAKLTKSQEPTRQQKIIEALRCAIHDAGRAQPAPAAVAVDERAAETADHASNDQPRKEPDFYAARARHEESKAGLRELELKQKRGELVELVPLNAWVSGMILRARDILTRIGPELRDRLAQETDPNVCEELVNAEVMRAMRELSEYKSTETVGASNSTALDHARPERASENKVGEEALK